MNYLSIYNSFIYKRQNIEILSKKQCYCERHHIIPRSIGGLNKNNNLVNLTAREHYIAHLLLYKIYQNINCHEKYSMLYALIEMCDTNIHKIKYNSRLYEKHRLDLKKSGLLKINGSKGGLKCWEKYNKDPKLKERMIEYHSKCLKDALNRMSEEQKEKHYKKISNGIKKYYLKNNSVWLGRKHTSVTIDKMKKSGKKKNIVSIKNPMFGKIWIFNEKTYENKIWSKNIKIPDGWIKGRRIK